MFLRVPKRESGGILIRKDNKMKIDTILKGGQVFRTYRQCFEPMDVALSDGKFYYLAEHLDVPDAETVDCTGKYIVPGLIDIHMHVESSMTWPQEFSRTALLHGTTTVVADPHEIANVFGLEGVESFLHQKTGMDIFYGIPSSVPSTDEQTETSGGRIGVEEVAQMAHMPEVLCLGEVMNFKDMVSPEDTLIQQIIRTCRQENPHLRLEGHCPKLSGEDLAKFIYLGVDADHTQQSPASVLEKIDNGMFLELQRKSLVPEVVEVVNRYQLYEHLSIVTDDTMPDDLMKGHLNLNILQAVKAGFPMEKAIYCATYTPARRMGLNDRGAVAPGKKADFLILSDLNTFHIDSVWKDGMKQQAEPFRQPEQPLFPEKFYHSFQCKAAEETDFEVPAPIREGTVRANVMKISDFGNFTRHVVRELPVRDGKVCWQETGLSLLTIFERYGKNGNISHAFNVEY